MASELPTTTNGTTAQDGETNFAVKAGLARMLKGGVIMDVVNAEQVTTFFVPLLLLLAVLVDPAYGGSRGIILFFLSFPQPAWDQSKTSDDMRRKKMIANADGIGAHSRGSWCFGRHGAGACSCGYSCTGRRRAHERSKDDQGDYGYCHDTRHGQGENRSLC